MTIALSIVLCLTLGPPIARRVAHSEYDDDEMLEKQGTDSLLQRGHLPVRPARVRVRDPFLFRAASMRCGEASVRRRRRARAARRESDECARTDEAVGARG